MGSHESIPADDQVCAVRSSSPKRCVEILQFASFVGPLVSRAKVATKLFARVSLAFKP